MDEFSDALGVAGQRIDRALADARLLLSLNSADTSCSVFLSSRILLDLANGLWDLHCAVEMLGSQLASSCEIHNSMFCEVEKNINSLELRYTDLLYKLSEG